MRRAVCSSIENDKVSNLAPISLGDVRILPRGMRLPHGRRMRGRDLGCEASRLCISLFISFSLSLCFSLDCSSSPATSSSALAHMPPRPFLLPICGHALRAEGQLWYMYQFESSPSYAFIPSYAPSAQNLYAHPAFVKWNKARPWEPFAPRHAGQWAPYGWNAIFGPQTTLPDYVQVSSGLHVAYQLTGHLLDVASDTSRLILLARPLFSDAFNDMFSPAIPEAPPQRAYSTESAARAAVGQWREVCLDNLAFFAYKQSERSNEGRIYNTSDSTLVAFLDYFLKVVGRKGVAFDPAGFTAEEDWIAWRTWALANIPFAYRWSAEYAELAELAVFDPLNPNSKLTLDNADDPGPRSYAIANSSLAQPGRRVHSTRADSFEQRFQYSDIISVFEKINVRVFWKDKLWDSVDASIPWSDFYADIIPDVEAAAEDDDDTISLGSAPDEDADRPIVDVADLIARYGASPAVFNDDGGSVAATEVPTLVHRLASPAPSSTAVEGASRPAAEAEPDAADEPFDATEMYRNIVADLEDRFEQLKLFMADDGDIEVIPQEIHLPVDPRFVEHCDITFPAATELWFLYKLAFHRSITRRSLWYAALKAGLPFRPRFSEIVGRRLIDEYRVPILSDWPPEDREPAWIASPREPPLPVPQPISNATYELQYRRTIERVRGYPHFEVLMFYGGLTWRLVLEFGSAEMGQTIAKRPSTAWILGRIEAPTPLFVDDHSEVFETPESDGMVMALHGQFSNGLSLWPPPSVFLQSYRWRGMWTAGLETWFKQHLHDLRHGLVQPRGEGWWRRNFARPIAAVRQASEPFEADKIARKVIDDIRAETSLTYLTILRERGLVPANSGWRDEWGAL